MTSQILKFIRQYLWIILIVIAYGVLQFFTLGTRSLDGDEGVILNVIQQSNWHNFWARIASDVHPPLYHLLAKLSVSLFGIHEWSLRLPAALSGGLCIIAGFWLGKTIWQNNAKAILLATLMGFAPYLFYYHGEARFYSLLLLLAIISYTALLKLSQKISWQMWLVYTIAALGMVYTQHLGWIILILEFVAVLLMRNWRLARAVIFALAATMIAYLPNLPTFITQFAGRMQEQGGIKLSENIAGILGAIYRFGAGRMVLGISPAELVSAGRFKIALFVLTLIVPLIIVVIGVIAIRKNTDSRFHGNDIRMSRNGIIYNAFKWLSIILIIGSILLALFYSEMGGRATRYLIYLWPFYGVLLVGGMTYIWRNLIGKLAVVLLCLMMVCSLLWHFGIENTAAGARDIAQALSILAQDSDAVLAKGALAGGETAALEFYYPNKNVEIKDFNANYKPGKIGLTPGLADQLHELLNRHNTVWYYDFTYSGVAINQIAFADGVFLGYDKENKPVYVYRFIKQ